MKATYLIGDTREVLRSLPDTSVDLVLSSPPFLALRSYLPADHPDKASEIGSEATPGEFVDTILDVVEECRRVLAPHGSLVFEFGDTYAGSGGAGGDYSLGEQREGQPKFTGSKLADRKNKVLVDGRRIQQGDGWPLDKSLCLVPELVRLSLAYGFNPLTGRTTPRWRIRNVHPWLRPNPPVGALADKWRPATSYLFSACVGRKRFFDLDAVRTEGSPNTHARTAKGVESRLATLHETNGAPPKDWILCPTEPYVTPDGTLHVPAAGTFHRVRVPVGAGGDGIQRTTSPSCPVHGSPGHPGSSAPGDGRGEGALIRTERNGAGPAREPDADSPPTPSTHGQLASGEDPAGHAATRRSTADHRTGLAPSTSPAGTPSAQTLDRTDDTPGTPVSSEQHHDKAGSSSAVACHPVASLGTEPRTVHTSDPSAACTCSYSVEVSVAAQSTWDYATWPDDYLIQSTEPFRGSHYATWPRDLLVPFVKCMSPERVCRVCGVPSERVVEPTVWEHKTHPLELEGVHRGGLGTHGDRRANPTTLGWTDCGCSDDGSHWRPGIVLDPFAGSGTTLAVATGHGRDAIGVDLDERNASLAAQRVGMFLEVHDLRAGNERVREEVGE